MSDSVYWIWHQLLFGIGTRRAEMMLEYFGTPENILRDIENGGHITSMLTEKENGDYKFALTRAEEIKRRTLRKGCEIITPDHPLYPPLLHGINAKPSVLYVKGNLACLQGNLVIAMVGTRGYTDYGRDVGRKLAEEMAVCGVVIVSGLAQGIDTICHAAALKAGGKSVGILGCGIDIDYPKGSSQLKRNLVNNGAVLSEYPLGTEPKATNFPMRNRLISGMSDGTVVVEADLKSGSLLTGSHALEQNRELFAVPGSIFSFREQGTHKLIKEGAKLTESALDIFEQFTYRNYPGFYPERFPYKADQHDKSPGTPKAPAPRQKAVPLLPEPVELAKRQPPAKIPTPPPGTLPEEISPAARAVYSLLGQEPKTVEQITVQSELGTPKIQSALTQLEIYGLIKGHPGRRFSR